ncbi:uncharacterized protein H6S33_002958 [Morchella sextelata]|uniref:uncharacterized protein n=1 Tax=Morchella sextelata TaxID=1174677 RepID=UPI001D04D6F0|nr:uncharacterized protein H6S33_002958 [Morchella sextelata]KAH0606970.1 hypothetical protein H6S33_002958 [Morchella sextelata]
MAPRVTGSAFDGRWDGARSLYLLPPLVGLPLPDMRANGYGARNAGNSTYYRLIVVHAVFACLAFLLFIPAAIVCTRYLIHGRNPRTAMYGHIGSNTASIICLTITFAAGFSAVGRENWGTNPHHIIGATLYAGVLFQALFGAFVRWRNSTKIRKRIALHTMLHQWLGRCLLFLGLAQIPLGFYLYGSPLVLFILYGIFMALFVLVWFILDYLSARDYFHNDYHSPSNERPPREMTETGAQSRVHSRVQSGITPHASELGEASRFDEPVQTPRRGRFSLFSNVFKKRESGMNRESEQMVIDDRGTSFDTSRAPSTSLVAGGLGAPPGRQPIPPVPNVPQAHLVNPNNQANLHRDNNDQYAPQREEYGQGYRDSTTLGHGVHLPPLQQQQHISMPESPYSSQTTSGINSSEPVSEVSALSSGGRRFPYVPVNTQYERIGNEYEEMPNSPVNPSDVSALSAAGNRRFPAVNTQYEPISREYEEMPPSPMGYMEVDDGFARPLQGGAVEPPMVPLPMPPEPPRRPSHSRGNSRGNGSRGRTSEDVVRLPISHSNEFLTLDRREATPGFETIRLSKGNPNVSVQVRVNPDGKSVTVRRIPTEEAERDRRERARQRAERAQQRERSMDIERQNRRSGSANRGRRSSSVERPDTQHGSSVLGADSNISSAIAGHSGGLLGGSSAVPSPPSRHPQTQYAPQIPEPPRAVVQTPINQGVPLPGWTGLGGGISPSQRGSVVSATGTEANSELEQEMAKDYRRKKRREERSGMAPSSQAVSGPGSTLMSSSIGYGDDAEDGGVQWT